MCRHQHTIITAVIMDDDCDVQIVLIIYYILYVCSVIIDV